MPEARVGGSESLCLGLCPSWDLGSGEGSHSHPFTIQHIAFGITWEQQGSLARHQVLPSFSLSSCYTNDILYIVLYLLMEVNKFGDHEGRVPLKWWLLFIFSFFIVTVLGVRRDLSWVVKVLSTLCLWAHLLLYIGQGRLCPGILEAEEPYQWR